MSLFGTLPTFDHRKSDWTIFVNQLESFFIANDIGEDIVKKKAILITSLTQESHKLLKGLIHPVDINDATYDELTEALNKHFKPASSCFVDRFKFYCARKDYNETVQQFAAKLRSLAANCDFDTHLSMMLRDKFIMSLPKGPVKDKLFMEDEKTLTFEQAVEIAASGESINPQQSQRSNEKSHFANARDRGPGNQGNQNSSQHVRGQRQGPQQQQHNRQNQQNPNKGGRNDKNVRTNENSDQCNIS